MECHFCNNINEFKFITWDETVTESIGVCGNMDCMSKIPFKKIKAVTYWLK